MSYFNASLNNAFHGKILKQAYSTVTALSNFHMKLQNKRLQ